MALFRFVYQRRRDNNSLPNASAFAKPRELRLRERLTG